MNANTAVSKVVKCDMCGDVTTDKRVGDSCERIVEGKESRKHCSGIYGLTNGQKFRDTRGFSKTLKRNMRKLGLKAPEEIPQYRQIRNDRRREQNKVRKDKHSTAKAHRSAKKSAVVKK